ncbi:MAG: hypothetical protein HY819_16125 [Acidobacteria bacterium]|nr:hypothetical protein [Acidobacteriota bacterium]
MEKIKYARFEYERRFLVQQETNWREFVEKYSKTFLDKYIKDSRLRLRILKDSEGDKELIKLTKKYESNSPYFQQITTILLSRNEYSLFNSLEGYSLRKTRYYHNFNNQIFAIDVFQDELEGLILCEVEANSLEELMSIFPPFYVKKEVTSDLFFTGGKLSQIKRRDLLDKLSIYKVDSI